MRTICSLEIFTKKCRQQQNFDSDPKEAWHYNNVTFTPIAKNFMLYCRLIYMLSMLYVGLTIKVKVGIAESFKVGWYLPKITGSSQLKWLHSFVPSLDRNPLDSEFCGNIIESVKGQKSQLVMKKKPINTNIIRSILDIHNKEDSNLKNRRIAALCSLAFAGFFRYDVLLNVVPKHIEFHRDYIRIFVPRSKKDVYREGNYVFISAPRY